MRQHHVTTFFFPSEIRSTSVTVHGLSVSDIILHPSSNPDVFKASEEQMVFHLRHVNLIVHCAGHRPMSLQDNNVSALS